MTLGTAPANSYRATRGPQTGHQVSEAAFVRTMTTDYAVPDRPLTGMSDSKSAAGTITRSSAPEPAVSGAVAPAGVLPSGALSHEARDRLGSAADMGAGQRGQDRNRLTRPLLQGKSDGPVEVAGRPGMPCSANGRGHIEGPRHNGPRGRIDPAGRLDRQQVSIRLITINKSDEKAVSEAEAIDRVRHEPTLPRITRDETKAGGPMMRVRLGGDEWKVVHGVG